MASEIVFSKLGKIARLSLLDPGRIVNLFEVDGKYKSVDSKQLGFVNKVKSIFGLGSEVLILY